MNEHIAYYTRLLDGDPGNVDARLRLAAVWRSEGEDARAVRQYAAAARLLAKNGLLFEAIAACKAIFDMEPTHTETQLFLASIYARRPDSETVAQVIAAVQPDAGGEDPWPGSDDLDRIVGLEDDVSADEDSEADDGPLILLEAKDAVEELDETELVEVEDDESRPSTGPSALFDADDDQITSELEPLERGTSTPAEVTPYTPHNVKNPTAPATVDPFDVPLAKAERTDTTPIKARQKAKFALTYPERVLRRALSLTSNRGGNRADQSEVGQAPDAPPDIFPPPSDPGLNAKATATYSGVESGVVREILSQVMPDPTDTTRVSELFDADTVIGHVPNAEDSDLESSPSSSSTRIERPHPKTSPVRKTPEYVAPGYDSIEIVSPAVLSVSRADVPTTPLFSSLTPWAFVEILKRIDLRRVPAGEAISEPENRPRGLFIIVNGDVEVVRNQPDGSTKFLAILHRGEFFGEFELLTGRSHLAVVRAVNSVDLLHISEKVIVDLAKRDPSIWDVLWDFYHERLLNNMLAGSEIFGSLDSREREEISKEFRLVEKLKGEMVVRQGEPGTGIFLILSGEVEIVHTHDGQEESVVSLRNGEFFGTVSTLTDEPRRATARCQMETTLLLLERDKLLAIAKRKPTVKQALEKTVAHRQLLMGETSYAKFGLKSDSDQA